MTGVTDQGLEEAAVLRKTLRALRTSEAFDALLARVADGIASVLGAAYCGIYLPNRAGDGFLEKAFAGDMPPEAAAALRRALDPKEDPIVAGVLASRSTITANSDHGQWVLAGRTCASLGVSAVVATPILGGGGVHGLALSLLDTAGDRIPPRRLETAEAMAGALAPVVELEALKEETAHSSAERAAFWRMTSTALGESDTWKALERVCREARHITGAGGAAILLEDEGELRVAYSAGDGAEWSDELLVQATTGRPCMVPAEPVILHDLSEKLDIPEAELIRSAVLVPLCAHGKSIGVLQIVNPRKSLQKGQLREVTQLADRVAVVVEHFQLHEKREKMVVLEERHRMARELHDSVTQSVYAVTVFAEAAAKLLERERASDAMETLRELRDVGLMALREMRSLVFELHPPGIEKLDIIDALQIRLASVEGRSGLRAALHHFGVPFLPPGIKDGLYRIAQEALNNTLKHARASKIVLWLTGTPSGIRLELEDDGVGFDLEEGLSRGGLGLSGMEERAAAMNGTIKIEARPGKGVRIIIDVPLIESGNAGVTRGTGNSERTSPGRAGDGGSTDGGEDDQSPHRG